MNPKELIETLNAQIEDTFSLLELWFSKDIRLRKFRSGDEEMTIDLILEHISLANRYLLILIRKGTKKALRKASRADLEKELKDYRLSSQGLEQIGINNSFIWKSPKHMIPSGERSLSEIRRELAKQQGLLLENLSLLKNGEGVLHKTSMSVNSLGRLDVYQYIYFLLKHARRHLQQMEQIENEYNSRR
ncbi:MAG: hypothetical protein A2W19_08555 [Spirochaetes bacterium RBG_16_49_21]|nr:MAG: hypothetical protein A2W19_08555 [Spirochaetes bacterium RBG_16_49_21]